LGVKRAARGQELGERVALARELSGGPTTTVTLRLPFRMNEWLDAYVHGSWPERVKKQALVVEALQLLVARRGGPGQERLETDLLPTVASAPTPSARKAP
jgi:hypothetical protein